MKKKNIIFLLFGFLCILISSFGVNGALADGQVAYYKFDTNASDATGNGNDGVNNGATLTTGKIGQAYDFDGSDHIDIGQTAITGSWTLDLWGYYDTTGTGKYLFDSNSGTRVVLGIGDTDNKIGLYVDSSWTYYDTLTAGGWNLLTLSSDGSIISIYKNGALVGTRSSTTNLNLVNAKLGSNYFGTGNYIDGKIDEVGIWNRSLNSTEVSTRYNSNVGLQYPYQLEITFNSPLQDQYLNSTNFTLNVSFSEVTNSTYILNNGVETTLGTNENESIGLLTGIEGLNNLTVLTNSGNSSINFTIDTIAPNISVIGNLTQNEFEVNFSTIFNVTDVGSGLASCTITATYLENITNSSQYDKFVNCTDTVIFEAAGLYGGYVEAIDNAGNIATLTVNGTIQPFVYINFFDSGASPLINYDVVVTHPSSYVENYYNISNPVSISPLLNGSLDLGNYSVEFIKTGYLSSTFNIPINISSGGETYNFTINVSKIILKAYNRVTNALITSNIDFELIGPTGHTESTSTGIITIENVSFGTGNYRVVASGTNYESETGFFTYTGQADATKSLYLLPTATSNKGQVKIRVETPDSKAADGAIVSMLQWNPTLSAFTKVSERSADLNGEAFFDVELGTKVYVFEATKGALTARSSEAGEIISVDATTLPLVLEGTPGTSIYFLDDVEFSIVEDLALREQNISKITYSVTNSNGLVTKGCINYFDVTGFKKTKWGDYDVCVEADVFEIQTAEIPIDTNKSISVEITLYSGNLKERLTTINYVGEQNIASILESMGIARYVAFAIFILLVGIGITTGSTGLIITAMFGNMVIVTSIFPNLLTGGLTALLGILALGALYVGGNKG